MLTHLSLFSGIGGLDLAAEWAGFTTVGQCEWADYPTKVLEKHWPDVPRWRDIRELSATEFISRTGIRAGELTAISGGFPCQPFSVAGNQKGKEDERYLWPEMLRVIRELHPHYIIGENVPGILHIAADDVCKDLEREGYEVGIFNFEAAAVGAVHRRDRFFFVGYSKHYGQLAKQKLRSYEETSNQWGQKEQEKTREFERTGRPIDVSGIYRSENGSEQDVENTRRTLRQGSIIGSSDENEAKKGYADIVKRPGSTRKIDVAYTQSNIKKGLPIGEEQAQPGFSISSKIISYPNKIGCGELELQGGRAERKMFRSPSQKRKIIKGNWNIEPNVGRVANGIPSRVDRLKCLGNAVVPYQAYPIFKAIAEIEKQ